MNFSLSDIFGIAVVIAGIMNFQVWRKSESSVKRVWAWLIFLGFTLPIAIPVMLYNLFR